MLSPSAAAPEFSRIGSPTAVELHAVRKAFGSRIVLDDIDLTIRLGEFVAVLGPSGTGKTTLLRLLAGLEQADAGSLAVPAVRTVVFQEPRLVPAKRVWQNVVIGRRGEKAKAAALDALSEVGLATHADAWPKTLSGGEAQRVALARALVRQPHLLLLDEPFASLDALTRIKMHQLIGQLCQRHHPAVVLVTHDVDEGILLADRILVLSQGDFSVDVEVEFDRPRNPTDVRFAKLRSHLLARLGVESERMVH